MVAVMWECRRRRTCVPGECARQVVSHSSSVVNHSVCPKGGDMANKKNLKTLIAVIATITFWGGLVTSSMATAQTSVSTSGQPADEASGAPTEQSEASVAPLPAAPPAAPPSGLAQSSIADGEVPKGPIAPAFPPAIPSIDYGTRMRMGMKVQNPNAPDKMNDIGEQMDADIMMSGQIHRYFKWTASVTMSYTGSAGASNAVTVQPLDVFAHLALLPEFNIMMGRMLVIADLFAPGGPWGQDNFVFAGFFPLVAAPALPKAGPTGRDLGTTVWGAPFDGHAKYYLGVFNLNDPASHPLYTGRLQVSLLSGLPNFNQRATYYGTKDLIVAGIGGQYQKNGSTRTDATTTPPTVFVDDFKLVTGDLTFEKSIHDVGTVSAIGAFTKYWGQYQPWKQSYLGEVGFMLGQTLGIGKPRLNLRYQGGKSPVTDAKTSYVIDTQLSYNVHAWYARLMVGYRRGDTWLAATGASQASNMVYLGLQLWDP